MRWPWRRKKKIEEESEEPTLAYPYYVDAAGLRTLADSLGIILPLVRESSSDRRLTASAQGLGGERNWHDATQSEGHIHLNHLAAQLKRSAAYKDVVDVLGFIPLVSDPSILSAVIGHIEYTPAEEEKANDLLSRLMTAYDDARARTVAAAKREELKQVAAQNQLVILRGTFETLVSTAEGETRVCVRLTHLEASGVMYQTPETPADLGVETPEMPMPDGVGIEAVLPSKESFTDAGHERLNRGAPFYGRLIGHSASFDHDSGVLTCSAYAVWGMTRPARLLAHTQQYDFLEES